MRVTLYACVAAMKGHLDVVNALLAQPLININAVIDHSYTSLYIAAHKGHLDIVNALLAQPLINVNAANYFSHSPLYIAAEKGHLDVVNALLDHPRININAAIHNGRTPLYNAAEKGHLEVVNALLARGAHVDEKILKIAVKHGHQNIVKTIKIIMLEKYIATRGAANQPEYKSTFFLFGKQFNVGDSKTDKVKAAEEELKRLKGESHEAATKEQKKILNKGNLGRIIRGQ